MERLTKEAVREFIENRYPGSKIVEISMVDERETMAFVLMYSNTSVVTRAVVDINSEGELDVWSLERAHFDEFYHRNPDEEVYYTEG